MNLIKESSQSHQLFSGSWEVRAVPANSLVNEILPAVFAECGYLGAERLLQRLG